MPPRTAPILLAAALLGGCAAAGRDTPNLRQLPGAARVRYEPGQAARARQVAALLSSIRAEVATALGRPWRASVTVHVCGTAACMRGLGTRPGWDAVSTRHGLILGPGAFRPGVRLRRLLAHELVHALTRQYLGRGYWRVPGWFHEGVAVLLSGNGARGVTAAAARRALGRGRRFTFYCRRDPLGFNRAFRPGNGLHYRQAALFAAHLRQDSAALFRRWLGRVLDSGDVCGAYRAVYGRNLRAAWRRFVRAHR